MTNIKESLAFLKTTLPDYVHLVAVSKFHPVEAVQEAYDCGQRIFGENRPQEMSMKHPLLPQDIKWHMIGHLQTNKVKQIVPYVSMIESVDSLKLLTEINKQAEKIDRQIRVLLELHVAKEETKTGFSPEECRQLIGDGVLESMKHVKVCGLMCMATNTDDETRVHSDFAEANNFFSEIKDQYFAHDESFCYRSWGMTHDYKIAIEEGANIVRIGTLIFGERNYGGNGQ
jgi:pyridoxal phosphate enzyme (YggS family)